MTTARRHIGGWIAQSSIFAAVTRKLDTSLTQHQFKWLLEGGDKEMRRIGPHMGMAPMLLHRLSLITHFCAKLAEVGTNVPNLVHQLTVWTGPYLQHLSNCWPAYSEGDQSLSSMVGTKRRISIRYDGRAP